MSMDELHASLRVRAHSLLLAGTFALLAACTEDLDGGSACPVLCPGQNVVVSDTIFDGVVLDTVISGVPTLGSEGVLLLADRGDTLDTRVVLRFDSLTTTVFRNNGDSAIRAIDSAYIELRLGAATDKRVRAPVRIDLYDVDTTAADTSTAAIAALFRPDRLIGGTTFDTAQVKDSMRVFIDNAKLLAKITAKARFRVGLRISSDSAAVVRLGSFDASLPAVLRYDPVPSDTAIDALTVALRSDTPPENTGLLVDLFDYTVIVKSPPPPQVGLLSVGGLPGRRTYMRFDVPSRILDSATVLRATLLLTQAPNRAIDPRDSVLVLPFMVSAGEEVTDIGRSTSLLSLFPVDTVRLAPGDSGLRQIEVAAAVRSWSTENNPFRQQRAIVLLSNDEGRGPFDVHFFSLEAPAALRPRLRVSYSLRTSFGIP
jgi:hypothetical protein